MLADVGATKLGIVFLSSSFILPHLIGISIMSNQLLWGFLTRLLMKATPEEVISTSGDFILHYLWVNDWPISTTIMDSLRHSNRLNKKDEIWC